MVLRALGLVSALMSCVIMPLQIIDCLKNELIAIEPKVAALQDNIDAPFVPYYEGFTGSDHSN